MDRHGPSVRLSDRRSVGQRSSGGGGSGTVSAGTRDLLLFLVTLLAALGCARYYVMAVLEGDRWLSRAAAVAFFVFSVAAFVFLLQYL